VARAIRAGTVWPRVRGTPGRRPEGWRRRSADDDTAGTRPLEPIVLAR